jgi:hypothetical protein
MFVFVDIVDIVDIFVDIIDIFVDIGRIVYQQSLNFLFIINFTF